MKKASSSLYSIQPLLPPRLDNGDSYADYLAEYDMYVAKVKAIREANAKPKAVKQPQSAKRVPPPTLPQASKERLGAAFSAGKKFGSLEFSEDELSAARVRWQHLAERGRARAVTPLNGRERAQFNRLRQTSQTLVEAQEDLASWQQDVVPAFKRLIRATGGDPNAPAKIVGRSVQPEELGRRKTNTKLSLEYLVDKCEKALKIVAATPSPVSAKTEAKLELSRAKTAAVRAEADLMGAQAEATRRKALLKKTFSEKQSAHVVSTAEGPLIFMVPETVSTTESVLEAAAAAVETQPRADLPLVMVRPVGANLDEVSRFDVRNPAAVGQLPGPAGRDLTDWEGHTGHASYIAARRAGQLPSQRRYG